MDQRKGVDAAEKQNQKRSPVNTLINNWQEYAKYYFNFNKMFFINKANQT